MQDLPAREGREQGEDGAGGTRGALGKLPLAGIYSLAEVP